MEGTAVVLTASRGKIVIEPRLQPRYSLAELLRGVGKKNLHREIDTGEAVGREVW
jgi:antitoxin component of MazEF toxin-antitoxin module